MARKYAPRTYNFQLYKKLDAELSKTPPNADYEEFLKLIGYVTTRFELCEATLAGLLRGATEDPDLLNILFSVINSRSTRNQVILELIEAHRPARKNKHYEALEAMFKTYSELGPKRDQVAHAIVMDWQRDGKSGFRLQPSWHVERKHIAGLPTYHYDIRKLEALATEIDALYTQILAEAVRRGTLRTKRMKARHLKELQQPPAK